MKRRLVKLVVFLLLGASVTIGVACLDEYVLFQRTRAVLAMRVDPGNVTSHTSASHSDEDIDLAAWVGYGMPVAALKRRLQFGDATSITVVRGVIWPGFAINTVFYAGILWVLFAAPFALQRRRRIGRGLCPACAYPVGDSPVCTECGAAAVR